MANNIYKIDINHYHSSTYPVALYVKRPGIFRKWEFLSSYETKEQATEFFNQLSQLPVILGEAKHG